MGLGSGETKSFSKTNFPRLVDFLGKVLDAFSSIFRLSLVFLRDRVDGFLVLSILMSEIFLIGTSGNSLSTVLECM